MAGCLLILCELSYQDFFVLDALRTLRPGALSVSLPRPCQDGHVQVANKDGQNNRHLLKAVFDFNLASSWPNS